MMTASERDLRRKLLGCLDEIARQAPHRLLPRMLRYLDGLERADRELLALMAAETALEIADGCGPEGVDAASRRVAMLRECAAALHPEMWGEREAGGDGEACWPWQRRLSVPELVDYPLPF